MRKMKTNYMYLLEAIKTIYCESELKFKIKFNKKL